MKFKLKNRLKSFLSDKLKQSRIKKFFFLKRNKKIKIIKLFKDLLLVYIARKNILKFNKKMWKKVKSKIIQDPKINESYLNLALDSEYILGDNFNYLNINNFTIYWNKYNFSFYSTYKNAFHNLDLMLRLNYDIYLDLYEELENDRFFNYCTKKGNSFFLSEFKRSGFESLVNKQGLMFDNCDNPERLAYKAWLFKYKYFVISMNNFIDKIEFVITNSIYFTNSYSIFNLIKNNYLKLLNNCKE